MVTDMFKETPVKTQSPRSNERTYAADYVTPRFNRRLPENRTAIESLYTHLCDIYGFIGKKDPISGITEEKEILLYGEQPCRLSFELSYPLEQSETAASSSQRTKLFLPPEVNAPCGCKIVVTVNGEKLSFGYSGEQALYDTHKEIRLKPLERHK